MAKLSLLCVAILALGLVDPSLGWLRNSYSCSDAANAFINDNAQEASERSAASSDGRLFLTPYIEAGKLAEGRKLSEVKNLPGGASASVKSFSGFLTVNKEYNSNIFFWFFPPLSGVVNHNTPIILWLQGGPGATSLYGLFVENGPFRVTKDLHILPRNETWNKEFAIVFIDQPVGTGFSFTDNDKGYTRNEKDVARDLYEALKQFFTLYEDYRGNPFIVAGESYGGKYVPAITYKIHTEGENAKKAGINLQALAIGDGWTDPRTQHDYGSYLYQVGLIDELQRDHFYAEQAKYAAHVDKKEFVKAFQVMDALMDGDLTPGGVSYYKNVTGLDSYFNILYGSDPEEMNYFNNYLALKETRAAIHVGNQIFSNGTLVEQYLLADINDSVKPWLEQVLDANYRTLLYSGQLDVICAGPLTENMLKHMHWKRSSAFFHSQRKIYKVSPSDKNVAGYVRHADNFYYVQIRNSGHMVPYDQPRVAADMITRFIKKQEF